jgi:hypothetical protein
LDETGRCPECGLRAYWSLRAPEQLSQYPAKWVASMARATRLLAIAYGGVFLLLLAGFTNLLDGVPWAAAIGLFAAALLQLLAMWMLARQSGHWSEPRGRLNRLALWIVPVAPVIADAIGIYLEGRPVSTTPGWLPTIMLATMCGWVVAPPTAFFRIRTIARMIGDHRLARHSAIAFWGLLVTLLTMAVSIAVMMALHFNPVENLPATVTLVAVLGAILCFLLWGTVVMFRCVRDFGRAARVALRAETM